MIEVNLVAVLVAAIAGMVIGAAWYSKFLFGTMWMKAARVSSADIESAKAKGMGKSYALGFISALVMAYVLANLLLATGAATVSAALVLALWIWLGFVATVMLGAVLWENKSWTYLAINAAYQLVSLLVMAVVITLL